ncbi:hypothetical protein KM043_008438 [Ampulex compressa]|nr:hypothetical protein KM043_008438 [Ampulex compressa]
MGRTEISVSDSSFRSSRASSRVSTTKSIRGELREYSGPGVGLRDYRSPGSCLLLVEDPEGIRRRYSRLEDQCQWKVATARSRGFFGAEEEEGGDRFGQEREDLVRGVRMSCTVRRGLL